MIRIKIKNKGSLLSIALLLAVFCLTVALIIELFPLFKDVAANINDEEALTSDIHSYGIKGALIITALQAIQVMTAFFPSAAIQILAGLSYGLFYGMLFCLLGYLLGNTIVFVLVRQVDKTFTLTFPKLGRRERKSKWDFSFIKDSDHAAVFAVALFLIPGIPNGVLPYIFAKTRITLPRYLMSICIAGAPSILICSFVGERIANGDITTAVIIFGFLLLAALVVILSRNRIIAFVKRLGR